MWFVVLFAVYMLKISSAESRTFLAVYSGPERNFKKVLSAF